MEILNDRIEFDIEADAYASLKQKAEETAAEFFGLTLFDYSLCAWPAPNLKGWYQAKVTAWPRFRPR